MKRFEEDDIVISSDSVTATVWSDNTTTLTTFYTSSTQEAAATGDYYLNVYQTASGLTNAAIQFDIAYGHVDGSGSVWYNTLISGASPTRTIYGQHRTLILGNENASFIFGDYSASDFYALSIQRARFKEKLLPGTMTLVLSGSGLETLSLTDNSSIASTVTYNDAGRVYQMVSGAAGTVYTGDNSNGWTTASGSYGFFLPDIGVILLNPEALSGSSAAGGIEFPILRSSNTDDNNMSTLYNAISGGASFLLNSEETLSSLFAFIRVKNGEYNYSENPSFISGSSGAVIHDAFIENPEVYITAVGFYNDANELLAIAKLSRPLVKNFTSEALIRAKLDF